jgi:hypothetical protein
LPDARHAGRVRVKGERGKEEKAEKEMKKGDETAIDVTAIAPAFDFAPFQR